jgi:hypothetical protein
VYSLRGLRSPQTGRDESQHVRIARHPASDRNYDRLETLPPFRIGHTYHDGVRHVFIE